MSNLEKKETTKNTENLIDTDRKYMRSHVYEKNIIAAFFIVIILLFTGFTLGLLFAPESGRKFRKRVINRLRDFIDKGKFTWLEAKIIGEDLFEKGRERVEKASSKIKSKKDSEE